MISRASSSCGQCPAHRAQQLVKLGVSMEHFDYVVALAGNPNTGKSTVFNAITGLHQHTGNWPGKTVTRAEGGVLLRREPVQAGRPAGHVLVDGGDDRRGGRAGLHSLRPARRHVDRRRRRAAGTQSEPCASGAGDHRSGGALPQSGRRSQAPSHRRRRGTAVRGTGYPGRRHVGSIRTRDSATAGGDPPGGHRSGDLHAAPARPT